MDIPSPSLEDGGKSAETLLLSAGLTATLTRLLAIAENTYREAVRARILHGLLAMAALTSCYSLVIGEFALTESRRVVADLGSAGLSIFLVLVAIVLGATSLYRELELKTVYPILSRPMRRGEYIFAKFFGIWGTLLVFCSLDLAVLIQLSAFDSSKSAWLSVSLFSVISLACVFAMWRWKEVRGRILLLSSLLLCLVGFFVLNPGRPAIAQLLTSAILSFFEAGIVVSITLLFSSFSSPFLTAIFSLSVFLVGRSADTLAELPERMFGSLIPLIGEKLAMVTPNLMLYVPPSEILRGEMVDGTRADYLINACFYASLWSLGALTLSVLIFRRRDFV